MKIARTPVCHPERRHEARGLCVACYVTFRNKKDLDSYRLKERKRGLKRHFNMTIDEYDQLADLQQNLCALCSQPQKGKRLAVDHDHGTGHIRGLLCDSCNTGLGKFKDDPMLLLRAVDYLRRIND